MIKKYINTLHCKDNLELMKELPDNSIDLIYGDILYGTGNNFGEYKDLKINLKEKLIFGIIPETIYVHYFKRIKEFHRILKDSGSIYLQMDTRINHWIRIMMDMIFKYDNFRNEITWNYKFGASPTRHFSKTHDIILFYSKINDYIFNDITHIFKSSERTQNEYKHLADKNGNILMKDLPKHLRNGPMYKRTAKKDNDIAINIYKGKPLDWWEIPIVSRKHNPELKHGKYPTQKPKAILKRIILASSNKNDIVFDPYCGSGVTAQVAIENNRNFIVCDINQNAIDLSYKKVKHHLKTQKYFKF